MKLLSTLACSCISLAALLGATRGASAEPAMWIIKDSDSTIYLLGTVHLLRSDTAWQTPKIKSAVSESTELWLEVANVDASVTNLLAKYGMDPKKPLSRRLNPEQHERLLKMAESYSFPANLLEPMKPWYAGMTLMMLPLFKAGYKPNAGVETLLIAQASAEGDKIAGLEKVEDQLKMLDGLPEADQISYLMETLDKIDEGMAEFEGLVRAWSEGNTDQLADKFVGEMKRDAPSLYQGMIVARNRRWTKQISAILKRSGVQFVAVGAGHLVGPEGVPELLRKQGLQVDRY
jgi:hypothetical protein